MPQETTQVEQAEQNEINEEQIDIEPPTVKHDLDGLYRNFNHFISATAEGFQRSLLIKAKAGIGKTYQITNTLEDEVGNEGYVKISGHVSPLALYERMEDNRDAVIFLDDCSAVLKDRQSMELLKAATETEVDSRMVSWDSNTNKLPDTVDNEFEFNGQVIICANQIPDSGSTKEIIDSLIDRSIYIELDFTYRERIDLLKQVAYITDTDNIDAEERMTIANWIESVTDQSSSGVNLRTLFKCFNLYRYDPDGWSELAREMIDINPEVAYVAEALNRHDTVSGACEDYMDEFDKSRSSFYRRKRALE